MVNDRDTAIAVAALPTLLDRRHAPTSLIQAELPDLPRTRPLQFEELQSPVIRTAVGYWMSKLENGAPMRRSLFDATEIPHLLPYLVLLEVLRQPASLHNGNLLNGNGAKSQGVAKGGAANGGVAKGGLANGGVTNGAAAHLGTMVDFRYRVIGEVLQRYSRGNYAGKCMSEVDGQGAGSEVWAIVSSVAEQRRPVLLRPPYVGPHHHIFFCESCTLPLVDERGDTDRILIACDFLPETLEDRGGIGARA